MPFNEPAPRSRSRGGSAASNVLTPPRPSSSGSGGHRPPSYPSVYDMPPRPASQTSGSLQFFSSSSTSRPTSRSSASYQPSSALSGFAAPPASFLAAPPGPARVRGQRASTAAYGRAASPAARSTSRSREDQRRAHEQEERERQEELRLPGEEVDEFGLPIKRRPARRYKSADDSSSDGEDDEKDHETKKNENESKQDAKPELDSTIVEEEEEDAASPLPPATNAKAEGASSEKALQTDATEKDARPPDAPADKQLLPPTKSEVKEKEQKLADVKQQVLQKVEEAKQAFTPKSGKSFARDDGDSDAAFESAEENPEDYDRHPSKPAKKDASSTAETSDPAEKSAGDAEKEDKDTAVKDQNAVASKSTIGSTNEDSKDKETSEKSKDKDISEKSKDDRPSTPNQAIDEELQTPEQLKKAKAERLERIFETTLQSDAVGGVSAVSHQALAIKAQQEKETPLSPEEEEWQQMRAYGRYDVYDEEGHVMARGMDSDDEEEDMLGGGGARKGYTKLTFDDDAESQTSMDENTSYLFGERSRNLLEEDDEAKNPLQQMQATKDLLTDGQRIAYVGLTRLSISKMVSDLDNTEINKKLRKDYTTAVDAMKMWGQKMMVRLYAHMEIESPEQIMIEQLTDHGVQPADLTPLLMQNARVKNPMAEEESPDAKPEKNGSVGPSPSVSQQPFNGARDSTEDSHDEDLPAYEEHQGDELTVQSPSMLPSTQKLDIDLRWTVLCDLFLVLIADSIYDSRSRKLLESVGDALKVSWMDICKFEKRVTDALEMEEAASRENWDEKEHVESRRKLALRRRYMYMGLATVGGSIVIGLSAGVLAPVIGAGLGAGFTAIGVSGTGAFMAGAGGAAIITSASATAGGIIAVRASNRRTGAVKTFEYRPLHNNKRVNLIVTVSGWMNSKVDDVRLPFSTVDPVMGDIYSLLWEPDILCSIGDTIRILATEALTQGVQQVLAATFLTTLMAGLSLPIVLSKLSYLIDNPWSVSQDRADAAGLILADSLVDRNLGVRPITLVGFSLGARVIFSCLRELANKGAYGLVHNVYLFGAPVVAKKDDYLRARTVISGRFVNGYATNDWIIGYLFRATAGGLSRVAGLAAVEGIPGLENLDVTSLVNGHMAYRAAMPRLLREVGWEVESDEFAEIEDPDPDNHEARQRELIREIDSARQNQEKQATNKGRWNFWSKKEKKGWEVYDVSSAWSHDKEKEKKAREAKEKEDPNANVLFDIDAIRRELESEQLQVKEIESTLPPMRLDMNRAQTEPGGVPTMTSARGSTESPREGASPRSPKLQQGHGHGRQNSRSKWLPFGRRDSKAKTAAPAGAATAGATAGATGGTAPGHHRRTSSWEEYDETADGQPGSAGGGGGGNVGDGDMTMSFGLKSPERAPEGATVPERSSSLGGHEHGAGTNGWGDDPAPAGGGGGGGWSPQVPREAPAWDVPAHQPAAAEKPEKEDETATTKANKASAEQPPIDIDHNAWADDVRSPGTAAGEMTMTFE